jgi:hypothetical protein
MTNGDRSADAAALDLMKQLITLASGVLALSATFIAKLGSLPAGELFWLVVAWAALVVSVISGIETISAIVKSRLDGDEEWSKGHGKKCGTISKWTFIGGVALFALFAFLVLSGGRQPSDEPDRVHINVRVVASRCVDEC